MIPMRFGSASTILIFTILIFAGTAPAQTADDWFPSPFGDRRERDVSPVFKEMLSKQRVLHDKKEFAELQQRVDDALRLSEALFRASNNKQPLAPYDRDKLLELEQVVKNIRDDLGADDPGDSDGLDREPESLPAAVKSLQEMTASLVGELKNATRFTISAKAIEKSNSVLQLIRFIRLKK